MRRKFYLSKIAIKKLNLSYFISKKIRNASGGFASAVHKIAVASIGLGLAAAIVSFLIMKGFQEKVQEKIFGFSAHININKLTPNNSVEEPAFDFDFDLVSHPENYPFVDHVQEFAHKPGLVKTDDEVLGVLLKGVGKSFDQDRFSENMVDGQFIAFKDSGNSNDIVISKIISDKLKVNTGDDLIVHFFQDPPRFRKLKISGIYETNLSDYFDNKIILCDLNLLQRLNNWPDSVAGGLQVYLKDSKPEQIQAAYEVLIDAIPFDLYAEKTSDRYIQVFEWLGLITRQVNLLLVIILCVVCVNMISVVLILVMERTSMIGLLKALGSPNKLIRRIFIYQGVNLIIIGLLVGNIIGLGICFLQDKLKPITLDAKNYYMSYVPVSWHWDIVLLLNLLVLGVVWIVLLIPVSAVSRINPIKAIRFD
jgi:lipoprotein-releasing system permease protein